MKNFIKNRKVLTSSIIALVIFMLFLIFFFIPKNRSVRELRKLARNIDERVESTQAMLGDVEKLGMVLVNMQTELTSFEKRLTPKEEISSVLSEFSNLAKHCSVEVISIKPENPKPLLDDSKKQVTFTEKPVESIEVKLKLQAIYKSIAEYIKNIQESLNILATINYIDIRKTEDIAPCLDAELVLTVYVIAKG